MRIVFVDSCPTELATLTDRKKGTPAGDLLDSPPKSNTDFFA